MSEPGTINIIIDDHVPGNLPVASTRRPAIYPTTRRPLRTICPQPVRVSSWRNCGFPSTRKCSVKRACKGARLCNSSILDDGHILISFLKV